MIVTLPDGTHRTMSPRSLSGKGWSVGVVEDLEVAAGERIRFTGTNSRRRLSEQGARSCRRDQRRRAGDTAIGWQHLAACARSGVIARLQLRSDRPQRAGPGRLARRSGEGHAFPHDTPSLLLHGPHAGTGCGCRGDGFVGAARPARAFGASEGCGSGSRPIGRDGAQGRSRVRKRVISSPCFPASSISRRRSCGSGRNVSERGSARYDHGRKIES